MPIGEMNEADIAREIACDEMMFGPTFAHAAEAALRPGDTIYNMQGLPTTVVRVAGRRFVWAVSEAYPHRHLIDRRAFSTKATYDPHDTLIELIHQHEGHTTD